MFDEWGMSNTPLALGQGRRAAVSVGGHSTSGAAFFGGSSSVRRVSSLVVFSHLMPRIGQGVIK